MPCVSFERSAVILQAKVLNVLVGIIQHRMEVAAQIHQIVINGGKLLLQHAPHLSGGIGGGIGGVGFDQVNDRFRLGQIQLAVQEGSLGKFPPLGRLRPRQIQRLQPGGQHGGGAVAVEFHRVLPGVAVRAPGNHRHALVEAAALLIVEGAQIQAAIRSLQQ